MVDLEGEIECLDEDVEIVQQCVRSLPSTAPIITKQPQYRYQQRPCLLTERPTSQKRKRKEEIDSEYEPSEEELPPSPPSSPTFKKKPKMQVINKSKTSKSALSETASYLKYVKNPQSYKLTVNEEFWIRKKHNIHIPDYDDPLCLPVRAFKADEVDVKRLENWNNACLEHFKHCDTLLRPEQGVIKKSMRTAIFKNVVNRQTGQNETTICSKTCVVNEDSDKKSEIFQSVLPRYREKKSLPNFLMSTKKDWNHNSTKSVVVLSKEMHKDGEALVVYKPRDSVTAVYGLIDKRKKTEEGDQQNTQLEDNSVFLKELAACRMCAPCFQSSWRGITKVNNKSVSCPICGRTCVTAYNLLSHFKIHSASDVRPYKKVIATLLADMVEYHYRCRMCRRRFDSIRALRAHVKLHQGKERFICDVCKRNVNSRQISKV